MILSVKLSHPLERCDLCEFMITSLRGIVFGPCSCGSDSGRVAWIALLAMEEKFVTNLFVMLDSVSCDFIVLVYHLTICLMRKFSWK